jgi:hypothetical protein
MGMSGPIIKNSIKLNFCLNPLHSFTINSSAAIWRNIQLISRLWSAQIAHISFLGGWLQTAWTQKFLALLVDPFVRNPFDAQQNGAGSMPLNKKK